MKNRRLNVLFIAIIALAATPQAFQDAHRLVNAAHERVESEFWSVFLSYQTETDEAKSSARTELVAARSQRETREACPVEPVAPRPSEAVRESQSNEMRTRAKAEARRTNAQQNPDVPETIEVNFVNEDEVATAYTVRPTAFSEKEQRIVKGARLHARDAEKIAEAASRASMASSYGRGNGMEMKLKQIVDVNKILRDRTRNIKERNESPYEIQTPNTVGSM